MAGKDIYEALGVPGINEPLPARPAPPPLPTQAAMLTQIATRTQETAVWTKRIFWLLLVALMVFPVVSGITVAIWNSIAAKRLDDAGHGLQLGGNDKAMQDVLRNADELIRRHWR